MNEDAILKENAIRYSALFADYDPITGVGSPVERYPVIFLNDKGKENIWYLPASMSSINYLDELRKDPAEAINMRFKHDFEFWAYLCCKIQDKETKKLVRFRMRLAQRILLKEFEDMRLADLPIRIILLKARQYGGSTFVQLYMLWIQTQLMENWHSAICADDEGQSRNIRGMYVRAAREYPRDIGTLTLRPYQGSSKNRFLKERGCVIGIGSMQKPDNLRSFDFSMLHLSEVGFWKDTEGKKPEDLAQTLRATVLDIPMTLEVLESTAKGVGNFFHKEWLDAKNKISGYRAVFVPWFMIDLYTRHVRDYHELITFLLDEKNAYYKFLWDSGASLEGIAWYRKFKADNRYSDWRMQSEYPTNDIEAFQSTGARVFAPQYVQQMRQYCAAPEYIGQLFARGHKGKDAFVNIEFKETPDGNLWVWQLPDKSMLVENRYIIAVDIGGRSEGADYSTVRVLDRYWSTQGGVSEMVATWKGHLDQDIFAWVAAQIAEFWNHGLLIVETNSLRKEILSSEGDHYLTILDEIAEYYDNIFTRMSPEKVKGNPPVLYGLHMGHNKVMIIDAYNGALREIGYVERDVRVLDECDCYENKPDGSMGAVDGTHDDLVIPSAICVWADGSPQAIGPVREIEKKVIKKKSIISEASI